MRIAQTNWHYRGCSLVAEVQQTLSVRSKQRESECRQGLVGRQSQQKAATAGASASESVNQAIDASYEGGFTRDHRRFLTKKEEEWVVVMQRPGASTSSKTTITITIIIIIVHPAWLSR